MRHQKTKVAEEVDGMSAGNANAVAQSPGTSQVRQSPLQHYIMTGQLTQVSVNDVSSTQQSTSPRAQMLAQIQGLRVPLNNALSQVTSLNTGVTLADHVFSTSTSPSPGTSTLHNPLQSVSANSHQRQLTSQGGMVAVPPVSPVRYQQPTGVQRSGTTPSPVGGPGTIILQPAELRELQISSANNQPVQQLTFPSVSTVSASGGTIHHLGQSPTKGGIPPLLNPVQQHSIPKMNVQQIQQALQQVAVTQQQATPVTARRTSGSVSPGSASPRASQGLTHSQSSPLLSSFALTPNPLRTSPVHSPERPRKRVKLEEKPPATQEIASFRKLICDEKQKLMTEIKENYKEHLTELFFLQNGWNVMDYMTWKKRPTVQLLNFLKSGNLDSDDEELGQEVKVITSSGGTTPLATPVAISTTLPPAVSAIQHAGNTEPGKKLGGRHGMVFGHVQQPTATQPPQMPESSGSSLGGVPLVASSTTPGETTTATTPHTTTPSISLNMTTALSSVSNPRVPNAGLVSAAPVAVVTTLSSVISGTSLLAKAMSETTPTSAIPKATSASSTASTSVSSASTTSPKMQLKNQFSPMQRLGTRQHSISAFDGSLGSQEAIVERAKQEAQVMQRVADLRKDGLWTSRRLPKVQEPPRNKAHWDYLLEEMQWLAADFSQERKWKKAGARKISRMIAKYHQDLQQKEIRAEKEEAQKLKKIANNMAKMIKEFWNNVEKVVQYKQQSRLEEKRKKAMDLHLSFIVDQTEKYSSWLTEGLAGGTSRSLSVASSSLPTSPSHSINIDDEFKPDEDDSDDEETIEKEEAEAGEDDKAQQDEIEALKKESEMPIEEILKNLPKGMLGNEPAEESQDFAEIKDEKDQEFRASDEEDEDVEDTIAEQEKKEKKKDVKVELEELEAENEMSVEELMKKYAGAYDEDFEEELRQLEEEEEGTDSEDEGSTEEEEEEDEEEEEEQEEEEEMEEEDYLKNLMDLAKEEENSTVAPPSAGPAQPTPETDSRKEKMGQELTDIAATAEALQPTGYTLETTQVRTPVPFLVKHSLREYQHVGLDWLATLHDRKLNGILADEMGLGKTIQTIALLAHLACDKGVWGPHLIVVPTSVMLNWEMEIKKWCPAFKILTYYGSQKERKQKRQGWTKTNAFHVCITSYKLVIQDHQAFRRKKWKYFILDEAQNIKNFKSQRWQMLLNFSSQRRLLLTGTPLQNNLMELWSLMHFLMPHVFQSHRDFKEWFSNPLTGMIEGSREYNESLIKRLHKVLRPFLLRRLKADVEKQMPKKYEHVVMCYLSKRQRYLYDDFMSNTKTKETLATGHFMSVINVLMQLRKVCNHPNLFDPRPTVSPFQTEEISFTTASVVLRALEKDPLEYISPTEFHPCLADTEIHLPAFAAHRIKKLQTPRPLIVEIDDLPSPPARLKPVETVKPFIYRSVSPAPAVGAERVSPLTSYLQQSSSSSPDKTTIQSPSSASSSAIITSIPSTLVSAISTTTANVITTTAPKTQLLATSTVPSGTAGQVLTSQPITVQIQHTQQGTRLMIPSGQLSQFPGFIQIVQTSSGQQIIAPSQSAAQAIQAVTAAQSAAQSVSAVNGPTTTTQVAVAVTGSSVNTVQLPGTTAVSGGKPVISPITQPTASSLLLEKQGTSSTTITKTTSSSSIVVTPSVAKVQMKTKVMEKKMQKSPFYLNWLEERRAKYRKEKLSRLAKQNKHICDTKPVYGSDLCDVVRVVSERTSYLGHPMRGWNCGQGYVNCKSLSVCSNPNHPAFFWRQTKSLQDMIHTPEQYLQELMDILETFVLVVPRVTSPRIRMHCMHPPPSWLNEQRMLEISLHEHLSPKTALLHPISTRMSVHFPEVRLIQYDCGKLQTLDLLLRRLKSGQHRVLIFTQMTKMLDVLESFLNYHGHRYLRLDGTTKVEQRQVLMDRFNMDKRIFVFILSTRSGGVGVNLTGADTVIFYDSDWNPTMDAQAQDRCHRIGQTRDVHIYRLVSEMTVEENILKKANQKRLLSNVTIEGGNFTTAFFKENTIKDLFDAPSGLKEYAAEQEALEKSVKHGRKSPLESADGVMSSLTKEQMEQALCQAEDETDVQAAKVVHAEQQAELAEFDEDIPWDEKEAEMKEKRDEEMSRVEQELSMLEKELTPVERYAVRIVEQQMAPIAAEELELAEEEVSLAKEEWELSRLKALREEEERRAELEEDEVLYTYSRDDALNQVFVTEDSTEQMPMWSPPTPPQDDNDLYIDRTMCFLYDANTMSEAQLPPVYVKRENKRLRVDGPGGVVGRRLKIRKEDQPRAPRSLFDRHKLQKLKPTPALPKLTTKGLIEPPQDNPEWLIHEDWALLQAVQMLLELPLSLVTNSPAHIPNWDMVSDVVNASSRTYRSPKQCKNRYENVIVLREEGKILYDANPRKQKKTKGLYKTKNNRPMRTSQLYINDNSSAITTLWNFRFDSVKGIAAKRTPTLKPTLANPTQKNPKHAAVLAESNINYEQPLTPIQVADIRARRIAKEKRQSQVAAEQLAQKQAAAQQTANGTLQTAGTTTVTAVVSTQPQINIVQGQAIQVATSASPSTVMSGTVQKAVTAVSLTRSLAVGTGSIVVNTGTTIPASTIAAINSKRVAQTLSGSPIPTATGTASGSLTQVRTRVPMAMQEITAVTNTGQLRTGIQTTAQVITTTTLTPAQLVAGQRTGVVTATSVAGTVQHQLAGGPTRLTAQQMKALQTRTFQMQRLQAASQAGRLTPEQLKQQQQIKRLAAVQQVPAGQVSTVSTMASQGAQKTVSVTTPLITSVGQGTHLPQAARLQFQATQLIAGPGTTVQGVQSNQSVATFVKAVSSQGTATVPSMTIPVSAVNISNVNLMPQKALGKSVTPQQLQQLQIRQLQQRKLQQKAQIGVKGQLGQLGVQIIQQQPKLPVTMQHLQQIVKQQQAAGNQQPTSIQQIITSVPSSTVTTSQVVVTQPIINTQNITISSPTVSLTTLVKPSPGTVAGQLQTARQIAGPGQVLVSQALKAAQPQQQHPSRDVQQTVKQITAHAEAQAQQQRQVLTSAGTVLTSPAGVTPIVTVTQTQASNPVVGVASNTAQVSIASPSVTAVLQAGSAQSGDQSQQKSAPYTMRLRNPPKH